MRKEPLFNFTEPLPVYLAGVLVIIHLTMLFGPTFLVRQISLLGVLRPFGLGGVGLADVTSLIGHGFLHAVWTGSRASGMWTHLWMNVFMMIVFGIITIRGARLQATARGKRPNGRYAFIGVFLAGVIIGGLSQWALWAALSQDGAAIGASGGVSALFATTAWAIGGKSQMVKFGLGWTVINAVMVVTAPILGFNVAWAAHIGGYVAGAALAPIYIRPNSTGWAVT